MAIKGFDQIRRHLPDINTPLDVLRFFLPSILLWILMMVLFITIHVPQPAWQLITEIVLGSLGFGLLALFFRYREYFKSRFGPLAYSKAASLLGFPGVVMIGFMIARIHEFPDSVLPRYWGTIAMAVLGWVLVGVGVLLAVRTVRTFGVDNLTMLYVYFPEESHLADHKIYSVIRHPAYAAVLCITFGSALLSNSWWALACAFLFTIGLWSWLRLFEEKELIQRFGPSYSEYRRQVPAFIPHRGNLSGLFTFIFFGR